MKNPTEYFAKKSITKRLSLRLCNVYHIYFQYFDKTTWATVLTQICSEQSDQGLLSYHLVSI